MNIEQDRVSFRPNTLTRISNLPSACTRTARGRIFLLIGDSHAAQLWYGLSTTLSDVNVMQATASGCRPTIEQSFFSEDRCLQLMNYVFSDFLPTHHVDALLIAGRWTPEDIPRLSHTIAWLRNGTSRS
jgi:SGNH domain (fused to AT3 domains)